MTDELLNAVTNFRQFGLLLLFMGVAVALLVLLLMLIRQRALDDALQTADQSPLPARRRHHAKRRPQLAAH